MCTTHIQVLALIRMKLILQILLLIPLFSFGQESEAWNSFYDKETELKGYKNSQDSIVIKAKFGMFTVANKFDNIIAVSEYNAKKDSYDSYYLLKDGTKFGRDSLYVFDFSYACESEGFIKFQDKKKDLVGFFNSKAEVAIPAEYNAVSQMKNGTFIALKNAKKEYWDKDKHSGCNHWSWKGGQEFLVDSTNTILIEGFEYNRDLNIYSLKITDNPIDDKIRDNFLGTNGKYYSFINNKKEFEEFFNKVLDNLTLQNLLNKSYDEIVFFGDNGWTSIPKSQFFEQNGNEILKRFENLKDPKSNIEYSISIEGFLPLPENLEFILEDKRDNCGELNLSKYPIFNVLVTYKTDKGKLMYQDHYNFIKIGAEYELLSVTIRNN